MARMSKFERKREQAEERLAAAQKAHEAELKAIQEEERKEFDKKLRPVKSKFAAVVEESVEKHFKDNPDALEEFRFRKREVAAFFEDQIAACIEAVMSDQPGAETAKAPEADAPEQAPAPQFDPQQ